MYPLDFPHNQFKCIHFYVFSMSQPRIAYVCAVAIVCCKQSIGWQQPQNKHLSQKKMEATYNSYKLMMSVCSFGTILGLLQSVTSSTINHC